MHSAKPTTERRDRALSAVGLREAFGDRWIVGFVLLGLVLRSVYALEFPVNPSGDALEYLAIGNAFGDWWDSERAFRTPGYPAFLAASFELGLGRNGVLVAQAVILSAACYLAAVTAARAVGRFAGRAAAVAGAGFPPLVTLPSVFLSDALAAALFAGSVFALCEGWRRKPWLAWVAAASTLAAAATLVRPNLVLFFAVLAAIAILGAGTWRGRAIAVLAVVVPVLVLFAPWVVRNYSERDEATPLGTNQVPFILGVHLPVDMTSGKFGAARRDVHYERGTGPPGVAPLSEVSHLNPWDVLLDNVTHRPLEQLEASLFWQRELWIFPFDAHTTYGQEPNFPYGLTMAAHYLFLLLSLAGLWMGRHLVAVRIVAAGALTVALPFFVVLSSPRLAMPAIIILLVPAGIAAASGFGRLQGMGWRPGASPPA